MFLKKSKNRKFGPVLESGTRTIHTRIHADAATVAALDEHAEYFCSVQRALLKAAFSRGVDPSRARVKIEPGVAPTQGLRNVFLHEFKEQYKLLQNQF